VGRRRDGIARRNARELIKKKLDLIVANDVPRPGSGFEVDTNEPSFAPTAGETPLMTKLAPRTRSDEIRNYRGGR
jgi:phosphopantothenoylcysteine decarboxylase/phosphopantothenate--cysteine ligase